jgi:hypothetical protein
MSRKLPHSFLLLKVSTERLWIFAQADTKGAYTDGRTTTIDLPSLDDRAQLRILFGDAQVEPGTLSLAQSQGPVALEITR